MSTTAKHGIYIRPRSTLPSAVLATTSSHGATAPLIDMRSHQRIGVEIVARGNQVVHPNPTDPSRSVWIVELQVDIVEWHIVGGLWLAVLSGAVMAALMGTSHRGGQCLTGQRRAITHGRLTVKRHMQSMHVSQSGWSD